MKSEFSVIGLMSGSSLDGIDLAWCQFTFDPGYPGQLLGWELRRAVTLAYPAAWERRLRNAPNLSGRELWLLHTELGLYYGEVLKDFIERLDETIDFVAAHGHTVFHFPDQHTTTQIGDGAAIAGRLKLPVIDQFRTQDMAVGGQGAPLAPLADAYLFDNYFAALNLGGIANLSVRLPDGSYLAYDTGGANQVLDALMQEVGEAYDKNGRLARTGKFIPALKAAADGLQYHAQSPPKSLGNDWVRERLLPIFQTQAIPLPDRLHTYCRHVADQISTGLQRVAAKHAIDLTESLRLLVTGGGAFNGFLCECIAEAVAPVSLKIADPELAAYKEAILMALAGALRWQRQSNVLPSATGARRAVSGGAIHWAE